ncbi:MAG: phosphotransferase [Chloroflexi bacterium]|nr:phosphotransferase [Chloroflexota bacterium]
MILNSEPALPWSAPGWRAEVDDWIASEAARAGLPLIGPVDEARQRAWSVILRASTAAGDLYFKATPPGYAREAALTDALVRWHPACVPGLVAADPARGWLLMRDGGTTLRPLMNADRDMRRWHRVLADYAELQIAMAERVPDLLALGTLDRRLAGLPAQLQALLQEPELMRIDQPDGLSADEVARLRAAVPRYAALCDELAACDLPESIEHGDFHDNNVFVDGDRFAFFDWGDASVAHPFFSLVVVSRAIGLRLGVATNSPEVARARDAYLEPWTRFAPPARLRAAADLALRAGTLNRALTWQRALAAVPAALRAGNEDAVPAWLRDVLAATEAGAPREGAF